MGAVGQVTGWSAFATLAIVIVTAIVRGWLVPSRTVDRLLRSKDEVAAMKQQGWDTATARADVQQADLMKATTALTAALERSKPAGVP